MFSPLSRQIYGSLGTICLYIANGFSIGINSIMIPSLRKPDSSVHLTASQESWIPSSMFIMTLPSKIIAGYIGDKYGRKYISAFFLLPLLVCFVMLHFAKSFEIFLASSLIGGMFGGGLSVGPILIAEICSPKHRGVLSVSKVALCSLAIGVPHVMGMYFNWRPLVLYGTIPCIIGFITSLTSPESPAWLASKGRFEECKKCFRWFRGAEEEEELEELIESQNKEFDRKRLVDQRKINTLTQIFKFVFDKSFLKAFFICTTSLMLMSSCGKHFFSMYALDVVTSITGDRNNAYIYALGLDVGNLLGMLVSCYLIKKLKRRTLLFCAGASAVVLLSLFCLLSFLSARRILSDKYLWVTFFVLCLYYSFADMGVTPTLVTLMAEVYPLSHKGFGIVCNSFVFSATTFTVMKGMPSLIKLYSLHGALLVNLSVMLLSLLYLYIVVPETDRKTLIRIENEIKGVSDICKTETTQNLSERQIILPEIKHG